MPEIVPNEGSPDPFLSARENAFPSGPAAAGIIRRRRTPFVLLTAALLLCFAKPLWDLAQLSFANELYSHVLLIPAISLYLVWLDKGKLPSQFTPAPRLAAGLLLAGFGLVLIYWLAVRGTHPEINDRLGVLIPAMLCCFAGVVVWCFGGVVTRAIAFPLAFLIFMSPMPTFLENGVTTFLQYASAEVSYWMLKLSGMTIFRDGTTFGLPQVTIRVAPECSGIRSSLVLFITGLLAAHLFFKKPWCKIALALSVIPLGILRNALRIYVLAELAVHVNPDILNSDLHHKGGPIFFVISLVPFFLLVWFLRRQDRKSATLTK